MAIIDHYARAVRTSDLSSAATADPTLTTDSDVVGAFGLASKRNALACALTRLFVGDNAAAQQIVVILSVMAWGKASAMRVPLKRTQATDMARAVLAWHRNGVCKACGGLGYELVPGAPSISDYACAACSGTRKVPFGPEFRAPERAVAYWLLAEVEREQSRAGPAALAKLAERL